MTSASRVWVLGCIVQGVVGFRVTGFLFRVLGLQDNRFRIWGYAIRIILLFLFLLLLLSLVSIVRSSGSMVVVGGSRM